MIHMVMHSLEEIWLMLPVLYISYIFIELYENNKMKDKTIFYLLQKFGPIFGALIGIIPQCGFSIIASILYSKRYITLGTLITVFISTSDEAIPILLSQPSFFGDMIGIILIKLIIGCIVGYVVDVIYNQKEYIVPIQNIDVNHHNVTCSCCETHHSIIYSAFKRTIKIFSFVFVVSFILNLLIHEKGEELIPLIFTNNSYGVTFLSSIVGFVPSCITSVVMTQLYINGVITYGALLAGLISNSGLGFIMLLKHGVNKHTLLRIVFILFSTALICGAFLQSFV